MKNNEVPELTEEQIEETESRIVSDAELIESGAEIKKDGRLEITKRQFEDALRDMEGGPYYEERLVNGHKLVLGTLSKKIDTTSFGEFDKEFYLLGFPDLIRKEENVGDLETFSYNYEIYEIAYSIKASFSENLGAAYLRLWEHDRDEAKKILDHVCEIADTEDDLLEVYKKTVDYINSRIKEKSD